MRFVEVHYDAASRQFKPAGHEYVSAVADGGMYLIVDLSDTAEIESIKAQSE